MIAQKIALFSIYASSDTLADSSANLGSRVPLYSLSRRGTSSEPVKIPPTWMREPILHVAGFGVLFNPQREERRFMDGVMSPRFLFFVIIQSSMFESFIFEHYFAAYQYV